MASDIIEVKITSEYDGEGFDDANEDMGDFVINTKDLKDGLTGLATAMAPALAGWAAIGTAVAYSVGQAAEAELGQAQLAAVLESTGEAAGMTAEEVNAINGALAQTTTFGDDAILTGQNLLLTFTNIGEDVFPRATETMLDMATALGTDAAGSAIQLGKALNDPIQGITALTRVGVSFTEEQKEQIRVLQESGDIMGAQTIILDELAKEFGGSAAAAAQTFTGRMEQLKNQVGEAGEAIGFAFLPMLTDLGEEALPIVIDAVENLSIIAADQLEPALADLVETGGELAEIFGSSGFSSTVVWETLSEELAGVNEKLLLTQGYIEALSRPMGARWDIITAFGDVGEEADTAAERVEGYRAVLEQLDIQQGLVNEELREGKEAAEAQGNAYDYLIPKVETVTTDTQALTGAYDFMIQQAIINDNRMEHYGETLGTVEEASVSYAETLDGIVAGAMERSGDLIGELFVATGDLQTAQELLAASPWSEDLTAKVETAEGEVTASFEAIQESHRQMVVDILIQQTQMEGGFNESQANIMVGMGLMTQAEADMRLAGQETTRQIGLLGDALIETFLEDGSISREEAALLEEAISGVEEGAFTAGDVIAALARDDLGALISQSDVAIDRADTLKDRLLETEGDYQVNINVSVTGDEIPDVPSGSTGGGGQNPGAPQTPTFAGGGTPGGGGKTGGGGTTNYFTMNVYTNAAVSTVINDFMLMESLAGAYG